MSDKISTITLKILFYLIPIGLVTGPFIPDLSLSLIVLIFIFLSIKNNLWKYYYDNKFFKFFLLFNFYLIISSLVSDDISLSLKSSIGYFRFFIFSLAMWYLLENSGDLFKRSYSIYLFILFLLLSLDALYQFKFTHNILGYEMSQQDGVSSFFNEKLVLGGFFARMFPLTIALFFMFSQLTNKFLLSLILFLLGSLTIVLSGERTALGLFFILIFLIVLVHPGKKELLMPILFSIFLLTCFFISNKQMQYRLFVEPLHQSNLISSSFLEKNFNKEKKEYSHDKDKLWIFSREHESHYKTAFKIFLDNPIIGVGPKMFRKKCADKKYNSGAESCSTHPHNFLLQILSETGIIGFIFYLVMLYFIISRIINYFLNYKKYKEVNYIKIVCLITLFINLFPFLPTGNIFNNWLSIIFYFPCGFLLHQINLKNRNE
jgi:O-antigen ligase